MTAAPEGDGGPGKPEHRRRARRAGQLVAEEHPLAAGPARLLRSLAFSSGSVVERDGCSLAALGRAESIPLPGGLADPGAVAEVEARLERLSGTRTPTPASGTAGFGASSTGWGGALAVGALPFLPTAAGELTVPEVAVLAARAGAWAIVVAEQGRHDAVLDAALARARRLADGAAAEPPPDGFRLESARSHGDFLARVEQAVSEVRSGRLDKVVLAREVVVEANRAFRQADLLERLRSLHPSCTAFSVDGFLGATPELLVRRRGAGVESDPLAGTAPRSGDPEADRRAEQALLSSEKERAEHRAVVEAIAAGLAPVTAELLVPPLPDILELRNVSHLRTKIRGRLSPVPGSGRSRSVLEVLALIHPTPAVSGSPIDLALEYLAKSEELDRGRYAGPVGFVRADGDGEFHLGIRSASVEGAVARLCAGVGIVADSDPAAELRETQLKLQAVLAAAVRP